MKLVTAAEMRALDHATIHKMGVPGVVLMESAGRAVADLVSELGPVDGRLVVVVCGAGNNGGDGFVVARHLHGRGADVRVILVAPPDKIAGDAKTHLHAVINIGLPILDGRAEAFDAAAPLLDRAWVIVDALLGTGVARPVEGHLAAVIERINAAPAIRVAVDLPSGLDADRGWPLGTCVEAHHTVTFGLPKIGLATAPGFVHAGRLRVADIGIPPALTRDVWRTLLDDRVLAPLRAPRSATAHKGTFGHALIVAGSRGHTGAALLAGEACARAGAGLVTIASPDEAQASLQGRVVEVMTAPIGAEPATDAAWGEAAWSTLAPLCEGKRAIAFGPGVPRAPGMRRLLERLLAGWRGPLVIDADGLNLLAEDLAPLGRRSGVEQPALAGLPKTAAHVVLTPHPAEMARLARTTVEAVQADRVGAAEALASRTRAVVVLKGARTVIASPEGPTAINPTGGPALGSGGTGDVLTGVIAALLAGGLAPFEAACAGAYLHGRAGDRAAEARGDAGVLARDVIDQLPAARRG